MKGWIGIKNVEVKTFNPTFKEVEITGEIDNDIIDTRIVTLCQLPVLMENNTIFNQIGFSIKNPVDERSDLGENISLGRAFKTPINAVGLVSSKRLPKQITEEQFLWAEKYIERNLHDFVNNIREAVKP